RTRPNLLRSDGADEDAVLFQPGGDVLGASELRVNAEPDQVGVNLRRVERQARRVGYCLGENLGVLVIVGQALDVVVERVGTNRGDDAGLPHAAAEELACPASLRDDGFRPGQGRADRGAEALAEADRDRVEVPGPVPGGDAGGNDGVPQAGAVEV